jgi:membrane protein implicated in regulation of membrane protease activity
MLSFLEGMDPLQQGFWYIALIFSAVFLIQTILTFIGGDASDGLNADFDGNLDHVDAPFQLFSLRNLINFLLGFGWTGVAFYNAISSKMLLVVLAAIVGIIFVALFFFLIQQILKLTEDNTFAMSTLKGKTGEVYINIPPNKTGKGKILVSVKGSNHELDAMTVSDDMIASSTIVKVIEVENNILLVSRI